MKSGATTRFWSLYRSLPETVRRHARNAYRLWDDNPSHRSLHFKQVHATRPIYSIRIGLHWRVLGERHGDEIIWFWIGTHAQYDRLVARRRGKSRGG